MTKGIHGSLVKPVLLTFSNLIKVVHHVCSEGDWGYPFEGPDDSTNTKFNSEGAFLGGYYFGLSGYM